MNFDELTNKRQSCRKYDNTKRQDICNKIYEDCEKALKKIDMKTAKNLWFRRPQKCFAKSWHNIDLVQDMEFFLEQNRPF